MTRAEILQVAKPLLFNTEMTRAVQNGTKTATRRPIKMKYGNTHIEICKNKYGSGVIEKQNDVEGETFGKHPNGTSYQRVLAVRDINPLVKIGDILYVRETWSPVNVKPKRYLYKTNCSEAEGLPVKWHSSIHMPKEAARIFLRVTGVKMERLQDMKFKDFIAEGVGLRPEAYNDPDNAYFQAKHIYEAIWNSTIKESDLDRYGWNANPWVWVIEFEKLEVTE